jgi:hypothetical protein
MVVPLLVPPPVPLLAPLPALIFALMLALQPLAPLPAAEWALPELEPAPWRALLPVNSELPLKLACLCSAQWGTGV